MEGQSILRYLGDTAALGYGIAPLLAIWKDDQIIGQQPRSLSSRVISSVILGIPIGALCFEFPTTSLVVTNLGRRENTIATKAIGLVAALATDAANLHFLFPQKLDPSFLYHHPLTYVAAGTVNSISCLLVSRLSGLTNRITRGTN